MSEAETWRYIPALKEVVSALTEALSRALAREQILQLRLRRAHERILELERPSSQRERVGGR
jgi:hypothetical protein